MALPESIKAVRKHQLEGIVAKRAGSSYRSGERSADWLKWRANRGQEFAIGGYIPNGDVLDSLLVGYYEGRDLMYVASVRAGIPLEFWRVLVHQLEGLRISRCPFVNLPDRGEGENRRVLLVTSVHRRSNRVSGVDTGESIVTGESPESEAIRTPTKLGERTYFTLISQLRR